MTGHVQGDLLVEARRLRDEGMAQTEAADAEHGGWDKAVIDQCIQQFVESGREFSANDLRELLPDVRQPLIGARVRAWAASRRIQKAGRVQSTLASTHAHEIAVWKRPDHAAG